MSGLIEDTLKFIGIGLWYLLYLPNKLFIILRKYTYLILIPGVIITTAAIVCTVYSIDPTGTILSSVGAGLILAPYMAYVTEKLMSIFKEEKPQEKTTGEKND